MKATKEQAAYFLPFVQALAEGENLEFRNRHSHESNEQGWSPMSSIHDWFTASDITNYEFRVAPEPKLRPWESAEQIPVGKLFSPDGKNPEAKRQSMLILESSTKDGVLGFYICRNGRVDFQSCEGALDANFYHSVDCGETWKPCGVLEP